ncbi:MAG: hypothetical protein KDI06_01205 [Calditrichaeota bacterium]|nr:hypothetical protein [Calditrichota bacterium]
MSPPPGRERPVTLPRLLVSLSAVVLLVFLWLRFPGAPADPGKTTISTESRTVQLSPQISLSLEAGTRLAGIAGWRPGQELLLQQGQVRIDFTPTAQEATPLFIRTLWGDCLLKQGTLQLNLEEGRLTVGLEKGEGEFRNSNIPDGSWEKLSPGEIRSLARESGGG